MLDPSPVSSTAGTFLHTAASLKYALFLAGRCTFGIGSPERYMRGGESCDTDIGVLTDQKGGW